jgi:thioredoxin-related protein
MSGITWRKGFKSALTEIKGTGKLLFMFFHHPKCGGCKKTMETTFKDKGIVDLIECNFIPLTYPVTEEQGLTTKYQVEWTPTFILADENGNVLERWVGYLPPEDFISQLYLSEGLSEFHMERYKKAGDLFGLIVKDYPDAELAPEARYFLGVSHYKESCKEKCDESHLVNTYEHMSKYYPGNSWIKKASAWAH